ncbi:MAG TPA: sporulation protein YunB [Candidatus Caccalectryoclostridium excrementigallinarum]|uniref:Sporulation protein YunB n=1 Tax=Candidatus Caccalectryoclostridium excrementigallinarum TaxID=2840710 RepID=A0A9D1SJA3_9FIRM|nr:sporulation protein YunB [Candidatus Caccalectryoclostridium excrementigallinarum]
MPYYVVSKKPPKRAKKKKIKAIAAILTLILLFTGAFFYFNKQAHEVIDQLTRATISNRLTVKMNAAFDELMASFDDEYSSYVHIERNSSGEITLITADMIKINKLMAQYSTIVQSHVSEIEEDDISVPMLAFTGWPLVSTLGADIKLDIVAVGDAPCSYRSEFKEVGINQTLHSIYIDVSAKVEIILPIDNIEVECPSSALVCESVIVGRVPQFYLQNKI